MPGPPTIEVVVPVRGGAAHLEATLASVARAASPAPAGAPSADPAAAVRTSVSRTGQRSAP
jgi:hypothetical protein